MIIKPTYINTYVPEYIYMNINKAVYTKNNDKFMIAIRMDFPIEKHLTRLGKR